MTIKQYTSSPNIMCSKYTNYHTDLCSIIESVDSISRDERDVPLTQYITNA